MNTNEIYASPDRALYEVIKSIADMMIERSMQMKILYGVVKSTNPLLVHYDDKLALDKDILIIPEDIEKNLSIGDALILLQKEGGQRFLVIGREPYSLSKYELFDIQPLDNIDSNPNQWYSSLNRTMAGPYWSAKALLDKTFDYGRRSYQPDYAIYNADESLTLSTYPYLIEAEDYIIDSKISSSLSNGDKVLVCWKGGIAIVMCKAEPINSSKNLDIPIGDAMAMLIYRERSARLTTCLEYNNRLYVSFDEIIDAYKLLDNKLSVTKHTSTFYSYGCEYELIAIDRATKKGTATLRFTAPLTDKEINPYISYISLLGSKDIVTLPVLWHKDTAYVLLDDIYEAMCELMIIPTIKKNTTKIPKLDKPIP